MRACATHLLPTLPVESRVQAERWIAAADAFERGELDETRLPEARVAAWRFHAARRETAPPSELDALRTIMFRLWPDTWEDWHVDASHFIDFATGAGLSESEWFALLQTHFAELLTPGGSGESSSSPPVV